MPKPIEVITEAIRSTKHPFRQTEDRPGRQRKNRYERRKVKELMRFGDCPRRWRVTDDPA
jgi:hypothetical protein